MSAVQNFYPRVEARSCLKTCWSCLDGAPAKWPSRSAEMSKKPPQARVRQDFPPRSVCPTLRSSRGARGLPCFASPVPWGFQTRPKDVRLKMTEPEAWGSFAAPVFASFKLEEEPRKTLNTRNERPVLDLSFPCFRCIPWLLSEAGGNR